MGGVREKCKSKVFAPCRASRDPRELHPRSAAMNLSGEGDSYSESVQSKWTQLMPGREQPAGPGLRDPGQCAPYTPPPPPSPRPGWGAELLREPPSPGRHGLGRPHGRNRGRHHLSSQPGSLGYNEGEGESGITRTDW